MSDTQTPGDPIANIPVTGTIEVMTPAQEVEFMMTTGIFKTTIKGQNNWPGNYENLNDRQIMNLVKMVEEGKAKKPFTIKAILTEALKRGLIHA